MHPLTRIAIAVSVAFSLVHHADAQSIQRSDASVIANILGEETLSQNTRAVVHAARIKGDDIAKQEDTANQYEYLVNWVLPSHNPSLLRTGGYFTTTHPIPTEDNTDDGVAQPGGQFHSPAMELLRAAKQAGKLDDLFQRISDIPDTDNTQQRRKAALLALIELARGRVDAASKQAETFYELVSQSDVPLTDRWPELLFANFAHRVPEMHNVTNDIFAVLKIGSDRLRETALGFHLQAIKAQIDFGESETLKHWYPSTRATASTRGAGHPNSRWFFSGSTARAVISHDIGYLHYQIPLTGNYEVESEVSIVPYEHGVVFVGGDWLSVPGMSGLSRGDYRSSRGYKNYAGAKLPKPKPWSRYRTAVRDQQLTTVFNGRELDRREFGYGPWLAVRNNPGNRGAVRNLRITGQPIIPDTVYPLLEGARSWKAYEEDADQRWSSSDDHEFGFLTGARHKLAGNARIESLAHYHRPVVENGVIEYEFFYKAGEFAAHPALERLAFLLNTDGVRLHWVDDGMHDQSFERQSRSSESKPVSPPLSLKEDDWNRVSLTFQDDRLHLAVNGTKTYTHKMIQSQRRLGLYYIASESTLQVRNMAWSGDWPKRLPPTFQQELAGELPDYLATIHGMQEHTRIDFTQPIDRNRFDTPGSRSSSKSKAYPSPMGLRVEPNVTPGYTSYWFRDQRRFFGDFDATLRFSDLTGSAEKGQADFTLRFIDEHGNRYGASRGFRPNREQLAALRWMVLGKDNTKTYGSTHTGDEASEGRLRLTRLDDTLYAMIAYGDSDQFHLLSTRKVLDPESAMMLRMEASRTKTAKLSAVLEEIVIRTHPPGERNRDLRVTTLEKIAQSFQHRFDHDFTKRGDNMVTVRHGTTTDNGMTLNANPAPASATFQKGTSGDFDVAINLGVLDLKGASTLAIKLEVGDEPTNVELAVQRGIDESFQVVARTRASSGEANEIGTFNLQSIETLRLMRIQRTIFFICKGKTKTRMIGYADIGTGKIRPGSIQVALTAKSSSASAELKSLLVQSAKL